MIQPLEKQYANSDLSTHTAVNHIVNKLNEIIEYLNKQEEKETSTFINPNIEDFKRSDSAW